MTRTLWLSLLVAGAAGGCVPNNFVLPNSPAAADKAAKAPEPPRPAYRRPVVADQVNGVNAQEKAQALREELDRDLQRAVDADDAKDGKKK